MGSPISRAATLICNCRPIVFLEAYLNFLDEACAKEFSLHCYKIRGLEVAVRSVPNKYAGLSAVMNCRVSKGKTGRTKRIILLTGLSLALHPRALKEAIALSRAGFDVIVLGASRNRDQLESDQALAHRYEFLFKSVADLSQTGCTARVKAAWPRLRGRIGQELFRFFGVQSQWQIGTFVPELFRQCRAENADYYIAHLEQALWVGANLICRQVPVGVDLEDWFSEDLLPEARRYRPIRLLRRLERQILRNASHSSCPSRAMSRALAEQYDCRPPAVVYNAFPWADRQSIDGNIKDRRNQKMSSIHWYSQTVGHGRGLEDLLAALPFLKRDVEVHLRGNPVRGFEQWLKARVPDNWRDRIFIHGLVPGEQLLSRIAEHDIGFAGEMKYCRNKDLTVSNKILHYLLGGLAVVASDTTGQQEVAEQADEAVRLYPSGNAVLLAQRLNELLGNSEQLARAKAAALRVSQQKFCWEKCEAVLLESVANALC